jgi:hypothetical protein
MDPRRFSVDIELNEFPGLLDHTAFGEPDQIFPYLIPDATSVVWSTLPERSNREQWEVYSMGATGPSEVTVLPKLIYGTQDSADVMAALEIAAEAGNESAFLQAASAVDWSQRPAADFVRAVELALAAGAHLFARNLAARGAWLYPYHLQIYKMAALLAPPRIVKARNTLPAASVRADQAWLRHHADEYRGRWVALREGMLLADGATAREVWDCLESTDGVMLTKVV